MRKEPYIPVSANSGIGYDPEQDRPEDKVMFEWLCRKIVEEGNKEREEDV